jgi:cholesterol transport system auxiliary component
MKKIISFLACTSFLCSSLLLTSCSTPPATPVTLYDLGPLHAAVPQPGLPSINIDDISVPVWLDSQMMYYRLDYANDQQPKHYAQSNWLMPPGQLFSQRLKARIAQAGGVVVSSNENLNNVTQLHLEADDFMQVFDSPNHSSVHLALRASVFNGRTLVAHKTFTQQADSASADAQGGARALAAASDAAVTDIMTWLRGLPLKK